MNLIRSTSSLQNVLNHTTKSLTSERTPNRIVHLHHYLLPFSQQQLEYFTQLNNEGKIDSLRQYEEQFKAAKRQLMQGLYGFMQTTLFSLVNTDLLQDVRFSYKTIQRAYKTTHEKGHYPQEAEVWEKAIRETTPIVAEIESKVKNMAHFPANVDAANDAYALGQKFYETLQQVHEINKTNKLLFSLAAFTYPELRSLRPIYGLEKEDEDEVHTPEFVFSSIREKGIGIPAGDDPFPTRDFLTFSSEASTASGAHFRMSSTPDSMQTAHQSYGFRSWISDSVPPAQLYIGTKYSNNGLHADYLEALQSAVKQQMAHRILHVPDEQTLLFCPKKILSEVFSSQPLSAYKQQTLRAAPRDYEIE